MFVLCLFSIPLLGGIPRQGITEISGESGCGKTQLSLQLSLIAQLPSSKGGLDGSKLLDMLFKKILKMPNSIYFYSDYIYRNRRKICSLPSKAVS